MTVLGGSPARSGSRRPGSRPGQALPGHRKRTATKTGGPLRAALRDGLVEGLQGGRCGMIFKLHHAVSDGVGLVRMTGGLMERSAERTRREARPMPPLPRPERAPTGSERLRAGLLVAASPWRCALHHGRRFVREPLATLARVVRRVQRPILDHDECSKSGSHQRRHGQAKPEDHDVQHGDHRFAGRTSAPSDRMDGTQSPTNNPSSRAPENQRLTEKTKDTKAPMRTNIRVRRVAVSIAVVVAY